MLRLAGLRLLLEIRVVLAPQPGQKQEADWVSRPVFIAITPQTSSEVACFWDLGRDCKSHWQNALKEDEELAEDFPGGGDGTGSSSSSPQKRTGRLLRLEVEKAERAMQKEEG